MVLSYFSYQKTIEEFLYVDFFLNTINNLIGINLAITI